MQARYRGHFCGAGKVPEANWGSVKRRTEATAPETEGREQSRPGGE